MNCSVDKIEGLFDNLSSDSDSSGYDASPEEVLPPSQDVKKTTEKKQNKVQNKVKKTTRRIMKKQKTKSDEESSDDDSDHSSKKSSAKNSPTQQHHDNDNDNDNNIPKRKKGGKNVYEIPMRTAFEFPTRKVLPHRHQKDQARVIIAMKAKALHEKQTAQKLELERLSVESRQVKEQTKALLNESVDTSAMKDEMANMKKNLLDILKQPKKIHVRNHQTPLYLPVAHDSVKIKKRKLLAELKKTAIVQGTLAQAIFMGYEDSAHQRQVLDSMSKEGKIRVELEKAQEAIEMENFEMKPFEEMPIGASPFKTIVSQKENDDDTLQDNVYSMQENAFVDENIHKSSLFPPSPLASQSNIDDTPEASSVDDYIQHVMDGSEEDCTIQRNVVEKEQEVAKDGNNNDDDVTNSTPLQKEKKDRASAYRALLQAEETARKQKSSSIFVDKEAEEEEEENALRIDGLGDFGSGVAQNAKLAGEKKDEKIDGLCEDDLEHIVDELSEDEADQAEDLAPQVREEEERLAQERIDAVMKNVRDGFGRSRKAYASVGEARGRFNLNELVAADGSTKEAARLGLLESDEEYEKEDEEEEDEETKMERMMKERVLNKPQIYLTSSEDESEASEEEENDSDDSGASDVEREKTQMKMFSERAKLNRRLRRMMDSMPEEGDPAGTLLERDEDSQHVFSCLERTNVARVDIENETPATTNIVKKAFSFKEKRSCGGASFSRIANTLKESFSSTTTSKTYVFTKSESSKTEEVEDETKRIVVEKKMSAVRSTNRLVSSRPNKKPKSSLFTALAQYKCEKKT